MFLEKDKAIHKLSRTINIIIGFLIVSLVANAYSVYKIGRIQKENIEIKEMIQRSDEANQKVLDMLKEVREAQKKQNEMLQVSTIQRRLTINFLKNNGLSVYTDLGKHKTISVSDMDKIIDYYDSHVRGGTPFKGKGYIFVKASKQTGLNPLYLYAHAAIESGFGKSHLAKTRHNYFGINAVDHNPDRAYNMGDSIEQGIMEGAEWIKKNYYDNGYTTLQSMKEAGYASDPSWGNKIISIANNAIEVL